MARRTVGAVTLETPSAAGRAVIAAIGEDARVDAEQSARGSDASVALAATYQGLCPACETHRYGAGPCGRCAVMAAQPSRYVLHTDGTWWDREALAEALS